MAKETRDVAQEVTELKRMQTWFLTVTLLDSLLPGKEVHGVQILSRLDALIIVYL